MKAHRRGSSKLEGMKTPDHSDNTEPAPQPQAEAGREPSLGVGEV